MRSGWRSALSSADLIATRVNSIPSFLFIKPESYANYKTVPEAVAVVAATPGEVVVPTVVGVA
jgi:hypothetical protein